ncbi:MAG: hypothetical protein IMZ61_09705 [Planctomycetes bacterium]|nr:hypothetical protein [Planctomycetota bacterium]
MKTIVWDVDDVLNDLMRSWFEQEWLPAHPDCKMSYSDITQNPPHSVLGISKSEYLASLDVFRLSDKARSMKPNPDVVAWLRQTGDRFRHLALTARPLDTVPPLAEWSFHHFGAYMRTFSVVQIRQEAHIPHYEQSKKEFLQWLNKADILIDDNQDNVESANSIGIKGILYPQPWNTCKLTVIDTLTLLSAVCTP